MKKDNKKGFTIIEVVLVLAIAGLIFMVVFLAVPRLQRGQRDSARKRHLGDLQSQIDNYASNNNGHLPDVKEELLKTVTEKDKQGDYKVAPFINEYLLTGSSEFVDPSGVPESGVGAGNSSDETRTYILAECDSTDDKKCISKGDWEVHKNVIYFKQSATCGDRENTIKPASKRKMAVFMKLENGGYHCLSNK